MNKPSLPFLPAAKRNKKLFDFPSSERKLKHLTVSTSKGNWILSELIVHIVSWLVRGESLIAGLLQCDRGRQQLQPLLAKGSNLYRIAHFSCRPGKNSCFIYLSLASLQENLMEITQRGRDLAASFSPVSLASHPSEREEARKTLYYSVSFICFLIPNSITIGGMWRSAFHEAILHQPWWPQPCTAPWRSQKRV